MLIEKILHAIQTNIASRTFICFRISLSSNPAYFVQADPQFLSFRVLFHRHWSYFLLNHNSCCLFALTESTNFICETMAWIVTTAWPTPTQYASQQQNPYFRQVSDSDFPFKFCIYEVSGTKWNWQCPQWFPWTSVRGFRTKFVGIVPNKRAIELKSLIRSKVLC